MHFIGTALRPPEASSIKCAMRSSLAMACVDFTANEVPHNASRFYPPVTQANIDIKFKNFVTFGNGKSHKNYHYFI